MTEPTHDIEEKLLFLERHVEQLDAVVREQHDRMDALQVEVDRLREELRRAGENEERSPDEDEPPHWGRG